jgi:cytochrome c peroxidase
MKRALLSFGLLATTILFFSVTLNLNYLFDYENQAIPNYITEDNTTNNNISDEAATLGRVLFYDKNLSATNTVSCANCHQQAFGFSDPLQASVGVNGVTGRHSMRLINARFSAEDNFFWDERAPTLEAQTTEPIQDHAEMGYSGTGGAPTLANLIAELEAIAYYDELFTLAFGDDDITENRIQQALAQFIRSIESFDSPFDEGLAQSNINQQFPNFTTEENQGKALFLGRAGCQACHTAPEFDIDPNSRNNGVVGVIGDPASIDVTNTRAPSLRDLVNPDGVLNGPMMHDGSLTTLLEVINHYDDITIVAGNNNLDNRLRGGGPGGGTGQNLNLTNTEKDALVAFLETLTGSDVYTNEKWSDPFNPDGSLDLVAVGALPISLLGFSGESGPKWNFLSWSTMEEIDFSHFEVERSFDGTGEWTVIHEQLGGGAQVQNEGVRSYVFNDETPLLDSYYRLRSVDMDGSFALSEVIYLQRKEAGVLRVFPNPNNGRFFITIPTDAATELTLMDFNGRVVYRSPYASEAQFSDHQLPTGVYLLSATTRTERWVERIVIQ